MSLFCWTQRKIFWRKFVTRLFWCTIDYHSRKNKIIWSRTALIPTFFRISSFVFSRTKTFIQVLNYLRVSKWWQNFHFWLNYTFNYCSDYNVCCGCCCTSCCQTPMMNIRLLLLCLRRSEVWCCEPTPNTSKIQICVFEMHRRPLLSRRHIYMRTNITPHESCV